MRKIDLKLEGDERFRKALARAVKQAPKVMMDEGKLAMTTHIAGTIKRRLRSGPGKPRSKSGIYARSIKVTSSRGQVIVSSNHPATMLENPPPAIVPRRRKWLTIPAKAALTGSSVPRGGARAMGDLRFIPIRPGSGRSALALLVDAAGQPVFWLKKMVVPRRYPLWEPAWRAGSPKVITDLKVAIRNVLGGGAI